MDTNIIWVFKPLWMKKLLLIFISVQLLSVCTVSAQVNYHSVDSIEKWNFHYQLTIIDQSHNSFNAPYAGANSLGSQHDEALSLTTTLFIGRQLWHNAALYFNPEISGGKGVGGTLGVAGFPNGETFRIGNATPTLYLGRLFFRQIIALKPEDELIQSDNNQLKQYVPKERLVISAGKFSLSDFFDSNNYSHDPRTQFMNWALMSNGAWDYPANTRGYTDGLALEYVNPSWALRYAAALEPTYANGPDFDYRFTRALGQTIEFTKNVKLNGHTGAVRFLAYRNASKAPNYAQATTAFLNKTDTALEVNNGKNYGGIKYGFGVNADQELSKSVGVFIRAGWNDGKTATWAFTEIDRTLSIGLNYKGIKYKRPDDNFGLAALVNGISKEHQNFLAVGGYGFLLGDGKLNYATENIAEVYYSAKLNKNFFLTGDYQFVQNPAYNADRGPVSFIAVRAHVEF
jgi:high affinity Mn2+ porin